MHLRSPDGAQRNPGLTLGVIADSAPGFRFAPSGLQADVHHRPAFIGCRACRSFLFLNPPKGAVRNDWAKGRARGPAWLGRYPAQPFEKTTAHGQWFSSDECGRLNRTEPWKQHFACVPHADGFVGLLHVPGSCRYRRRHPVRANCRPDIHFSRPLVWPLV